VIAFSINRINAPKSQGFGFIRKSGGEAWNHNAFLNPVNPLNPALRAISHLAALSGICENPPPGNPTRS
jgi:hypothetical protein